MEVPIAVKKEEAVIAELRVNDGIRAKEVRVVAPDGSQVGVQSIQEAMWLADQLGLDLVEVSPTAKPPVTKIMDYGKFKYEQSVKDREARKKQSKSTVKEITFRVKIGDHDFKIKSDRAKRFLENGDKVRVRIWFRGREASRPQLGMTILDRLVGDLEGVGKVDQEAKQEGRNMTMSISPLPRREQAKAAEAEAAANAENDAAADETAPAVAEVAPETSPGTAPDAGTEDSPEDATIETAEESSEPAAAPEISPDDSTDEAPKADAEIQ